MRFKNPLLWFSTSWGYSQVMKSEYSRYTSINEENQRPDEVSCQDESSEQGFAKRHILVFSLFLGILDLCAIRVALSSAIIVMVSSSSSRSEVKLQGDDICPQIESQKMQENSTTKTGEFDWDEKTQGIILGSFYYGCMFTHYIGGRLAEKYGGRLLFGLSVLLSGCLNLIAPAAAKYSTGAFVLVQVLEGMAEGVAVPAKNVMLSFWIPPQERARSIAFIGSGCPAGLVLASSVSAWLTTSAWGWPSVFYVTGILSLVWAYFWFRYVHDLPDLHPSITTAEKFFIKQGVGEHKKNKILHSSISGMKKIMIDCSMLDKQMLDVPWSSILTSIPFWALMITHTGNHWGLYCIMTELPTYLKNVHNFDVKQTDFVSALPYLLKWLVKLCYSTLMDHLLEKKKLSIKQIRRISQAIANYIPVMSLLLVSWAGCNSRLVIALMCISVGALGANSCGFHCGFQELAPNFTGTVSGISNTVAAIPGFVAPAVTGIIINNQQTLSQWRKVFQLMAVIYFAVCTLFLFCYSPEVQPWNEGNTEKRKSSKDTSLFKSV